PLPPAIDTLSLHDALPISHCLSFPHLPRAIVSGRLICHQKLHFFRRKILHLVAERQSLSLESCIQFKIDASAHCDLNGWTHNRRDRKSTRLNSSHLGTSYA